MLLSKSAGRSCVGVLAAILFLVLPFGSSAVLHAQGPINVWQSLGPTNLGGPISDVLIDPADPNVLIASSNGGGLWRSTNGGASWQAINLSPLTMSVQSLARNPIQPTLLYAGTNTGLLRSIDRGLTWSVVATFPGGNVRRVAVSADGQVVVAALSNPWGLAGGYQSLNDGATWTATHMGGGPGALAYSTILPRRGLSFYYDSTGGCYLYQHDAPNFNTRPFPCQFTPVPAMATSDPDVFYVGADTSVYRGILSAPTQVGSISSATAITAFWVDPTNSNTVIAGARDLWRSTDGGATFTQISDWSQVAARPGGRQYSIRADPGFNGTTNRRVYIASGAGLFRTDDIYAATPTTGWTDLNNGLSVGSFESVTVAADGALFAITRNQEIVRLPSGSTTASRAATSAPFHELPLPKPRLLAADPGEPAYVYSVDLSAQRLSRSTDGGTTFASLLLPSTQPLRMLLGDPLDGNRVYLFFATSDSGLPGFFPPGEVFRTTNARAATPQWTALPADGSNLYFDAAFVPGSSSTLWVAGTGNLTERVSRSTNIDASVPAWTAIGPAAFGASHTTKLTVGSGGQVAYLRRTESSSTISMWKTGNGGTTWSRVTDPGIAVNFLTTHPNNTEWVFAATDQGVYQSSDGAATWTFAFPSRVGVSSLAWRGTTLAAATRGLGLWTIDLPGEPGITTQATNQFVPVGRNATFTVWAAGAPAVTYRWQVSTDGGSTWTDLANAAPYSGVTTATLTITGATAAQSGAQYRSVITNSLGTVTSTAATLAVAGATASVTAGATHSCAVSSAGGASCWGANFSGQLGDGTTTDRLVPTVVSGLSSGVQTVAAGLHHHTCAVNTAGGAVCWGDNAQGQLGDGTTSLRLTPVAVSGLSSGISAIAPAFWHTCALSSSGAASCWGNNFYGAVGDGTTTNRLTPVPVSGLSSGVTAIATAIYHSCALTSGGVLCWGYNLDGRLGDGTTTNRLTPTPVSGLSSGIATISAGYSHTCALTTAGGVVCWGRNASGELGDGTTIDRLTPVAVVGLSSGVTAIAAGTNYTCALTGVGAVRCWGDNEVGQLGDGTTTDRLTPVAVSGLPSGATAVATRGTHTCALSGGGVVCWGNNTLGQLGDGTRTNRVRPVVVNLGLVVGPATLRFTGTKNGSSQSLLGVTPAQSVSVAIRGSASTWTASADQPWVQLTNASGTGSGQFTVSIFNPADVIGSSTALSATITVISTTLGLPVLATIPVSLEVMPLTAVAPFGSFDTPAAGASVAGSIAVTGWALDDQGVLRVELWRDLVPGETTTPYQGGGPGNGKVFIANAAFVTGARPDVEQGYGTYPLASRAGWGYLLLTQGLWNHGNGTYTLYAFAYDQQGISTTLGSKTITSNNATATKPFGAIDTPSNGETVSGSFWNFGWALTPNATPSCTIGPAGVQVAFDSGPLVPVSYGDLRTDVAAAFPGYTNTGGAGGAYYIDTTTLTNGTHQIGWLVTDSCGRAEGIGSRFFTVLNSSGRTVPVDSDWIGAAGAGRHISDVVSGFSRTTSDPIEVRRGLETTPVVPNPSGQRLVPIGQGERVEVQLPIEGGVTYAGYQMVAGQRRPLPAGSSLDAARGVFYWQPAAGFLGAHDLEFVSTSGQVVRLRAIVGTSVQAVIDTPQPGTVASSLVVAGWAIDEAAPSGSGIDTVHVWAYPAAGGDPIFLGVASYGAARPDIGALLGDRFTGASYSLAVEGLAPGDYDVVVYPHSTVIGDFRGAQVVRISVR